MSIFFLGYLHAQETDASETFPPLVSEVLQKDLQSASYRDLVIWAQDLGLPIRGTREELVSRLQEHYGFPSATISDEAPAGEASENIEVVIDTAESVDFFTIEEISEEYVRIGGEVTLSLIEGNTHHRITADQLILNRKQSLLTTMGKVSYSIVQNDKEIQKFTGESLSLNVKSWEGIFLGGVTVVQQNIDGKQVDMFFQGETVFRGSRNLVVFDNARIFTNRQDDPHFSIRAKKLWFLAPEEWAIFNTVLAVGRVPLLYLPFFFQPGDRLFFQPTIGFHSVYGTYIQTTTYIWGKSQEAANSFSVLQISASGEGVEREIQGAFLRPAEDPEKDKNKNDYTWKVMLDGYTKKGVYLATVGDMSGLGGLNPFSFRLGLAFTRMLFDLNYSEQNLVIHEGRLTDYWDSSHLFTQPLPFRYELELAAGWKGEGASVDFSGKLISDRYLQKDFYQRSESFSWDFALGRKLQLSTSYSLPVASEISFDSSYTPSFIGESWKEFSQYLRIRLDFLKATLQMQSKAVQTDRLPSIAQRNDIIDNNQRHFFYPYRLMVPNLQLSLSGTLVDYTWKTGQFDSVDIDEQDESEIDISPPWDTDQAAPEIKQESIVLPELQETSYTFSERTPLQFSLSYAITPSFLIDQYTNAQKWTHPDDMKKGEFFRSMQWENKNHMSLNHSLKLFGGIVELTGSTGSRANFASLLSYDQDEYTAAGLIALRESVHTKEAQNLTMVNTLKVFPFRNFPVISKSNANYYTNFLLLDRNFLRMDGSTPLFELKSFEFTDEFVRGHTVGGSLIFTILEKDQEFSLVSTLPPQKRTELTPSLHLRFWLLEFSADTKILTPEKVPVYEPINFNLKFQWNPYINLSQSWRVDPENEGELIRSVSSFTGRIMDDILVFSFDATLNKLKGVTFDMATDTWKNEDPEILRLETINSSLALSYPLPPFWKNRINLSLESDLSLSFNFLQFTKSSLTFGYGFKFSIYKSISIRFQAQMENKSLHVYFPSFTKQLGVSSRDFFVDLGKSLNIASEQDLKDSAFNLKSINLSFVQEFPDWVLTLSYEGGPELKTLSSGIRQYEWSNKVSFSVSWGLLKILSARGSLDDDEFSFTGSQLSTGSSQ